MPRECLTTPNTNLHFCGAPALVPNHHLIYKLVLGYDTISE